MKKSIGVAALLGVVCLALIPIAPVYAANWIFVNTNKDGAVFYYDSDTIQRSGNRVTIWEKTDYSRDKTTNYRQTITRYRYDCAERTSTLLQGTAYYPDGKSETFVYNNYEQKEYALPPDSVGETMLEAVCR
jgi:hypothetical protein